MDFLALPRRDLQALCKRNGIRANMTSAAMVEALRALPKIDGIEEYFKPPVPVPEPEVEAMVEEHNIGKQGSPLPRSRRVRFAAKSSEPVETEEGETGKSKRPPNKEDEQALGVARRAASRRAGPVPVVPQPTAVAEEDLKREAKRDNAPTPVVGRRGASRRARPSPAVAAPAAESKVPAAEAEQREVVEDLKRDASMDDAPAHGVGRRVPSRRARPAPLVAAMASKVVAKAEQRAPTPRGRRVKATGTSTKPIRLDVSDDEEKEDAEAQEDAQILGVGRRGGAGRRAQAEPVVAAPEVKAEEEQRVPIPRGRGIKAKSNEITRLDDRKQEKKEDTKTEEETNGVPAIGVGRCGASQRAPARSEAPATRRGAAASKAEEGDVPVEAVPIHTTRQRKPTMKAAAAAAAEEKTPRMATRRGAVMSTLLQQEVPHEPQEAVGAPEVAVPIRATRHRKPTMKAAAAAATTREKAPPRATRRGAVMRTVLPPVVQEEPEGVFSDAEAVGAPVSYQQSDALEEYEEASDPQKDDLNEDEHEDVVIIEDEKLLEETPTEEPSMTDHECTDKKSEMQEQHVDIKKCHALLATQEESPILGLISMVTEQASEDDESAKETCDAGEEMELVHGIPALQAPMTANESEIGSVREVINDVDTKDDEVCKEEYRDIVELQANIVDEAAFLECSGNIRQVAGEATNEDDQFETAFVQGNQEVTADTEVNIEDDFSSQEDEKLMEETPTEEPSMTDHEWTDNKSEIQEQLVDVEKFHAPLASQEESPILGLDSMVTKQVSEDDESANIVDEAAFLECSSNISQVAGEEETNEEVRIEDGLSCQEEGDVVVDKVMHDSVDETILLDCSSDISWIEMTSEMPENQAPLDEDGDKPDGVVIGDSISQATVTDEFDQEEKGVLITDEMAQGATDMHDMEHDQFETVFVQGNQEVTADMEVNTEDDFSSQEDEKLMEETPTKEPSITDHECTDNKSEIQEQLVDVEKCHAPLASQEESPILGLVSMVTEQASEDDESANIVDEAAFLECSSNISQVAGEETNEEDSIEDGLSCQEEGDVVVDKVMQDSVDKTILLDCSSDISWIEMTSEMPENQAPLDEDGDKPDGVVIGDNMSQATVTDEVDQEEKGVPINYVTYAGMHDMEDNEFKTVYVRADKVITADNLPGQVTDCEITVEENASLIFDEKQHSTVTLDGDIVFDHLKTDTAHADEQKQVTCIVNEVPDEVTGTDEVVEEKVNMITENIPNQGTVPNITDTMDECLKENHLGTDFGHDNEQKKEITATIEPEVSRAQDGGARKENALLDDVTGSLYKSIVTIEPSVSNNSSEKNTTEPMAVLEDKGVKVASECEDSNKLSMRQLKAKIKEKLIAKKNKEAAKRVALGRVDENVCRSHAKGQQQNLNLQQH